MHRLLMKASRRLVMAVFLDSSFRPPLGPTFSHSMRFALLSGLPRLVQLPRRDQAHVPPRTFSPIPNHTLV